MLLSTTTTMKMEENIKIVIELSFLIRSHGRNFDLLQTKTQHSYNPIL